MKSYLESFGILTKNEINAFDNLVIPKKLKKDEFYIRVVLSVNQVFKIKFHNPAHIPAI